jgi:hypothetical protein
MYISISKETINIIKNILESNREINMNILTEVIHILLALRPAASGYDRILIHSVLGSVSISCFRTRINGFAGVSVIMWLILYWAPIGIGNQREMKILPLEPTFLPAHTFHRLTGPAVANEHRIRHKQTKTETVFHAGLLHRSVY